jgi:hypothetical protein
VEEGQAVRPRESLSGPRRHGQSILTVLPILLVSAWCSPAAGQNPAGQLAAAREAYSTSVEFWAALQQDLPAELKKLPTAEAQANLQAAEQARSAVSKARLDYLNGLKSAYSAAAGRYKAPAGPRIEAKASIAGADKELLSDLDQATVRLDTEIKSVAATDRARAAALQKQKAGLLDLRSLVLRRGRDLDRFESELAQSQASREALGKAYGELANWASSAIEAAAKDDEAWAAAYARMRLQIPKPPEVRPLPRREPVPMPPPAPGLQSPPPSMQGGGSILVPTIGGLWVLNNPHARKLPSGAYEPASVRLQITQNGTAVEGIYECTFAVPANEPYNPVVRFNFAGSITNPILRFKISAPLSGTIFIRPAGAGTLEVSYGISNPLRTGIAFGAVPEESPQMLRKALR